MLVVYFDEVKAQARRQPFEWLAGIAVPSSVFINIESAVADIALSVFGDRSPVETTEIHASRIWRGAEHCSVIPLGDRLEILKKLACILADHREVKRIVVRIDVNRFSSRSWKPSEIAFMFFVEKVNQLARAEGQPALLIGDFESYALVDRIVRQFASYRLTGTPLPFGIKLDALVDTVHFTKSHHSRLLQLADAWAWFSQLPHSPGASREPKQSLIRFLRSDADIMFPSKYKFWPLS